MTLTEEIQVTEKMAAFIAWANEKGQEEIRRIIRERLAMLKEECEKNHGMQDSDGFKWDDALEPNDGFRQWDHGGDCNLCRKVKYCGRKCRANRLLKQITTPFLYEYYLQENPDAAAQEVAEKLTPDQLLDQLGVGHNEQIVQ